MRVLVMGGTEFISLHLLRALQARGHEVTVFNRGRQPDRLPAGVAAIAGDRKDHAGLRAQLAGRRFDAVYDVTYAPTLGEDVAALMDALEGDPHAIFVSTCRVYDHALPIPYSEETARGLYWGDYARHKIGGEDVLLERHRRTGQPVTIVRPTHVMGPLNTRNNETFFMDRIARGRPSVRRRARRYRRWPGRRPRRPPPEGCLAARRNRSPGGRCVGSAVSIRRWEAGGSCFQKSHAWRSSAGR